MTGRSSTLAYAIEAACMLLKIQNFSDAYPRRGSFKSENVNISPWDCPPFIPNGCDVFAPSVYRLRHVDNFAHGEHNFIAKWHDNIRNAEREVENAVCLSSAIGCHVTRFKRTTISVEVVTGNIFQDSNKSAWVILPIVENVYTIEQVLASDCSISREVVVHAIAALVNLLVDSGIFWRGLAPRNILIKRSNEDNVNLVLCDFERGIATGLINNKICRLEEISFCLEEFTNLLTVDELEKIFDNYWYDLAKPGGLSFEVPTAVVDSCRQRHLLEKWSLYGGAGEWVRLYDLEYVRSILRRWQSPEKISGKLIDPLPLLDCVTAGLSTQRRIDLSQVLGETESPATRKRLIKKLYASSKVLTILDLLEDAAMNGGQKRLIQSESDLREETLNWVINDSEGPPPGMKLLASNGLDTPWFNKLKRYWS